MKIRFLTLLMALGVGISCSEQEEEAVICDSYFLDTARGLTVFYNADELISEVILENSDTLKLRYNTNKKLEWFHTPGYSRYYAYDAQNRVQYILNTFNWTELDSLTFEYSNDDHLASAVNYYKTGNLTRRDEYSWDGENPSQVDMHYPNNASYSRAFEYDNNPKPMEHNFLWINFEFPDISFGVNNITKEALYCYGDNTPLEVQAYDFYYNEDNLPVRLEYDQVSISGYYINYTYRCSPRTRDEGNIVPVPL